MAKRNSHRTAVAVPAGGTACPGCGTVLQLDAVPNNSRKTSLPGKHCPVCNHPLNDLALESSFPSLGGSPNAKSTADQCRSSVRERLPA